MSISLRKYALVAAMALSLAGCNFFNNPVGTLTQTAPVAGSTLVDEKGLYAIEASYNQLARAYINVRKANILSSDTLSRARAGLIRLRQLVLGLRQAKKVGDAVGFEQRRNEFLGLQSDISALLQ